MKFVCIRCSDRSAKPCEEATEVDLYTNSLFTDGHWIKQKGWIVDINSIVEFSLKYGKLVVDMKPSDCGIGWFFNVEYCLEENEEVLPIIEIYDNYRE